MREGESDSQSERVRMREMREKGTSYVLVYFQNAFNSWGRTRLKSVAGN